MRRPPQESIDLTLRDRAVAAFLQRFGRARE
jgi:hypothetical protein